MKPPSNSLKQATHPRKQALQPQTYALMPGARPHLLESLFHAVVDARSGSDHPAYNDGSTVSAGEAPRRPSRIPRRLPHVALQVCAARRHETGSGDTRVPLGTSSSHSSAARGGSCIGDLIVSCAGDPGLAQSYAAARSQTLYRPRTHSTDGDERWWSKKN